VANIKDLKKKTKSTKNTFKITKAMKLVSAAKLAKAQQRIQSLKPYSMELQSTVKKVTSVISNYEHPFTQIEAQAKVAVLVISSDKGLCGSFNSSLAKKMRLYAAENSHLELEFYYVGKKVKDLLGFDYKSHDPYKFKKNEASPEELRLIGKELAELFTSKSVGKVLLAYNTFFSAMNIKPIVTQLLPFTLSADEKISLGTESSDYKYEPKPEEILDVLIPEVYFNSINTAYLDSVAAEHGSRMVAMENASKNCSDMIKKLTLKMNKLRQAAITTELTEVVSGAESLKG
jgi:F-type H+-transporting ATPase subunit gamma